MSTDPTRRTPARPPATQPETRGPDTSGPDTTTIEVTRKQVRSEQAAVDLARTVYRVMTGRPAPSAVGVVTHTDRWDVTFTE